MIKIFSKKFLNVIPITFPKCICIPFAKENLMLSNFDIFYYECCSSSCSRLLSDACTCYDDDGYAVRSMPLESFPDPFRSCFWSNVVRGFALLHLYKFSEKG